MTEQEITDLLPDYLLRSETYYVIITDLEGNYIYVNQAFKLKFSFLQQDFLEQPSLRAIYPEDQNKCLEAAMECIENPDKVIKVNLRKQDTTTNDFYWTNWEFSIFKDAAKNAVGILCLGYDVTESEKANREAKIFTKKAETIIEEITDGFYQLDTNWVFTKVNKAAEKILGSSRMELLGKTLWSIFPDIPTHNYPVQFRKAMEEHVTVVFDEYVAELDRWFSIVCYPSQEGLTVFIKEISLDKQNQKKLKYSESKLKAILDSTTDGNILVSSDYKILSFNKQANKDCQLIFNKALEEYANMWDYVLPDNKEDFYVNSQKALNGAYLKFERKIISKHFSCWFEFNYSPVYNTKEKIVGFTSNTTNINERKLSELKIKEKEYMLRAIYQSTTEGSTFIDKDLIIRYNNQVAKNMTKAFFGKEAHIGDYSLDYYMPEYQLEFKNYYQRVLAGESIVVEKTEGINWWKFTMFPVYDDQERIIGIANNVQNITEQKVKELKIVNQNETLKAIAWQQSHELRRPLSSILGLCDLLKNHKEETEEMKDELIDHILNASKELDKVVHKIVKLTRENDNG